MADAQPGYGVETIQDRLTPEAADAYRANGVAAPTSCWCVTSSSTRAGRSQFMEALKALTTPDGYVVIEVPDCSRAMDGCDYTTIWEEHTLYYTPDTFRHGLTLAAFDVVRAENYPYPFENSLVVIAKSNGHPGAPAPLLPSSIARERARGVAFGRRFAGHRQKVRAFLNEYRRNRGLIAMFGAGHLACTWVSVFGVDDDIECVIDDNPNKNGLFMPGSGLPIVGSRGAARSQHQVVPAQPESDRGRNTWSRRTVPSSSAVVPSRRSFLRAVEP